MDWPNECAAVIPCFDEAATVAGVVRGVRQYLPTVLVVDDGSREPTAEAAEAAGAVVVRHPKNLGKGAALRTGWREATARGFAWALCLDGDGQHEPADIPALLVRAAQTGADLVVGNRFASAGADMSWLRRVVNRGISRHLSRELGTELPDTQCGFRLLRLAILPRLALSSQRFEIESELLVNALRAGARVEFVPVKAVRKAGSSKIHPLADTWRWLKWWRRNRIPNYGGAAPRPFHEVTNTST